MPIAMIDYPAPYDRAAVERFLADMKKADRSEAVTAAIQWAEETLADLDARFDDEDAFG